MLHGKTRGDGSFRFDGLVTSDYRVRVIASGFASPWFAPIHGDSGDVVEIDADFGLHVSGQLLDKSGNAIQGAQLLIIPRWDRSREILPGAYARHAIGFYVPNEPFGIESTLPSRETQPSWRYFKGCRTDAAGLFVLDGVPPGESFAEAYLADGQVVRWPVMIDANTEGMHLQVMETGSLSVGPPVGASRSDDLDIHVRYARNGAELSVVHQPVFSNIDWPRWYSDLQPGSYILDFIRYPRIEGGAAELVYSSTVTIRSGQITELN
jgi:hypothetical protein